MTSVETMVGPALMHFPSIGGLHNVRPVVTRYGFVKPGELVAYRAKIKLHGSNKAIVVFPNGTARGQSRNEYPQSPDPTGFVAWAASVAHLFSPLAWESPVAVFGEWCGEGLTRKVAVSQVPGRMLAVFAIQFGLPGEEDMGRRTRFVTDPGEITGLLAPLQLPGEVRVLPWATVANPMLDFHDGDDLAAAAVVMGRDVEAVDAEDPWVRDTFGVSGRGEGLVYYPVDGVPFPGSRWAFAQFAFKAKGRSHQTKASENRVEVDAAVVAGAEQFADVFVTQARLEQGLHETSGGRASLAGLGPFLAWFGRDVLKESVVELEASGLKWRDVACLVTARAKAWFVAEIDRQRNGTGAEPATDSCMAREQTSD